MSQPQAVTKKKVLRYQAADRARKSRIRWRWPVGTVTMPGDYARVGLGEALVVKPLRPLDDPGCGSAVILLPALIRYWVVLRSPVGKVLAGAVVGAEGAVTLGDEQADPLSGMSAATIDQMLAGSDPR